MLANFCPNCQAEYIPRKGRARCPECSYPISQSENDYTEFGLLRFFGGVLVVIGIFIMVAGWVGAYAIYDIGMNFGDTIQNTLPNDYGINGYLPPVGQALSAPKQLILNIAFWVSFTFWMASQLFAVSTWALASLINLAISHHRNTERTARLLSALAIKVFQPDEFKIK